MRIIRCNWLCMPPSVPRHSSCSLCERSSHSSWALGHQVTAHCTAMWICYVLRQDVVSLVSFEAMSSRVHTAQKGSCRLLTVLILLAASVDAAQHASTGRRLLIRCAVAAVAAVPGSCLGCSQPGCTDQHLHVQATAIGDWIMQEHIPGPVSVTYEPIELLNHVIQGDVVAGWHTDPRSSIPSAAFRHRTISYIRAASLFWVHVLHLFHSSTSQTSHTLTLAKFDAAA
jgi:hypothetical protein